MSHTPPPCAIEPSPMVELIAAYWLAELDDGKPHLGARPLVDQARARAFVASVLSDDARDAIREPIRSLGLAAAIGLASGGIDSHVDAWEPILTVLSEPTAQARLRDSHASLLAEVAPDYSQITAVHNRSRYWESPLAAPLIGPSMDVRVIPSLFMIPAPGGKVGFYRDAPGGKSLTLVFGYAAQFGNPYLDWPQWYRLGITHIAGRTYWARRLAEVGMSPAEQDAAFAKLPQEFRAKVGIHDFSVSYHKNWASYLIDSLIAATKVLCEREISGEDAAEEQSKWFASLGRFHIRWFLERMEGRTLDDISLPALIADWNADIGSLTAGAPPFNGPLGACESPLWNKDVRLVFSPSVGTITRRTLQMWFNKYWPVKPTVATDSDPTAPDWDNHCNLVFCASGDAGWAATLGAPPHFRFVGADQAAPAEDAALVYVSRNRTRPDLWSRVCLAPSDQGLSTVHQKVRYYADWTRLSGDQQQSGPIAYADAAIAPERRQPVEV